MTSRAKLTVMLFIMYCFALHITLPGGLHDNPSVLVQQFERFKSHPSSSTSLGHFMSLILHLIFRICVKVRRFPLYITGVFVPLFPLSAFVEIAIQSQYNLRSQASIFKQDLSKAGHTSIEGLSLMCFLMPFRSPSKIYSLYIHLDSLQYLPYLLCEAEMIKY